MKAFLIKVVCFFAIIFVLDKVCGYTFSYLSEHSKGGYTGHYHYLVDKTNEDVLIFGSSRAIHHYNPQIIVDSLGLTCYNCGQDGNGIVLFDGWWKLIKQHYQPKLVVYDVTPDYDLLKWEDNHKFLGWLKEAYDKPGIAEIFEMVDSTEKFKMQSQMYRYNSKFHQIIADYIYPLYVVEDNGYFPINGSMDTMKINKNYNLYKAFKFDPLKLKCLEDLVNNMGETQLVFVVSPWWYGMNEEQLKPIQALSDSLGIPLFDYSNDSEYVHNNDYFIDGGHLNSVGADKFTKSLVFQLKNYCK